MDHFNLKANGSEPDSRHQYTRHNLLYFKITIADTATGLSQHSRGEIVWAKADIKRAIKIAKQRPLG